MQDLENIVTDITITTVINITTGATIIIMAVFIDPFAKKPVTNLDISFVDQMDIISLIINIPGFLKISAYPAPTAILTAICANITTQVILDVTPVFHVAKHTNGFFTDII